MHNVSDEEYSAMKLTEALNGNVQSQYELARLLEEDEDVELAAAWYKKAANQGHVEAAFRAGLLLLRSQHVRSPEAAYWFKRAAAAGHPSAHHQLSIVYERGLGVDVDPSESLRWRRLAARLGHEEARAKLNEMNDFFNIGTFGS